MATTSRAGLDVYPIEKIRADFPILTQQIHGKPLVYLDSAASSQKPRAVMEATTQFYEQDYSNIHRGVHTLSERATRKYEAARDRVRDFIGAAESREIIFTRGTTEAINLVAQSYGREHFRAGDEILISALEHHSNIVPWQILCKQMGAVLKVAPIDRSGQLIFEDFAAMLSEKTRLVAMAHTSNALGTILPIERVIECAHQHGVPVLLDGAQALPHLKVDVRALDVDFYAFSAHKLYGPSGIGALYAKADLLAEMAPYQGGGDMIKHVTFEKTVFNDIPYKFEAGTPDIVGVIGFASALDYIEEIGIDQIRAHEDALLQYATEQLQAMDGVHLIGTADHKAALISFTIDGIHPHDIGTILDREGVAIRAGHHCAQPVMEFFGVAATARASFAMYNTHDEVDVLAKAIRLCQEVFS